MKEKVKKKVNLKDDKKKKTSLTKEGNGGADKVKKKVKTTIKHRRGDKRSSPRKTANCREEKSA